MMENASKQRSFPLVIGLQVLLILAAIVVYTYVWMGIRPLLQQRQTLTTDIAQWKKEKDALIASVGALNYAKITPQNQVFQLKASAKATGRTTPDGKPIYRFSIYVDASPDTLQNINRVAYDFNHPTFVQPHREEINRDHKFQTQYLGWGCLSPVNVTVYLKDTTTQSFPFDMCKALGPEWD
jgi:hypothetical protein